MSLFSSKSYSSIYTDLANWIIANQDKVTDFNEGGMTTSLLEALSLEIEQIYLRGKIGFIKYLPELPFYAFGFQRLSGVKSVGTAIFSRVTADLTEITIPIGTEISSPSGLVYLTTSEGTILSGNTDSNSVSIESESVGVDYNVPIDSITVLPAPIVGVDEVTNNTATTGGLNEEDTNSFQSRFSAYILGLGRSNVWGYVAGALSVNGVQSASAVEHFPPLSSYYNVSLYIEDGTGEASAELIESVTDVINGDGTETNPGYRAAGINVRILAPTKIPITVDITITDNGLVDRADISTASITAISEYINNLSLGEDLVKNRIVDAVMEITGVYDLVVNNPISNVTVGATQIARIDAITINYYVP